MNQFIGLLSQYQTEMFVVVIALLTLMLLVLLLLLGKSNKQLTKLDSQHSEQALAVAFNQFQQQFSEQLNQAQIKQLQQQHHSSQNLQQQLHQHQQNMLQTQAKSLEQLHNVLVSTSQANREEQAKALKLASAQIAQTVNELTGTTDKRLQDISAQVEKRLEDGFEKTTKTFNDILKRLALIDDAQKKITELSTNVVSLQEVLADKRSRGAFGEVQLNALIRNVLPEQHFSIQHTLSNGKIADCILWLPEPTGNVVIDAKFPLESYRAMTDNELPASERKTAERQFKADIKKHINDISQKYLIDKETADGAIMFLPAEAVFAEIHGHYADLVEYANQQRVWITSPTTLMAVLTTARAVLKDQATREQVHLIQSHLTHLASDFGRFRQRFTNLAKHIDQAASDVKQIHTSADKIASRFDKIEQVELQNQEEESLLESST